MKGLIGGRLGLPIGYLRRPGHVVAGLDLSRKRINFDVRRAGGELADRGACPPDTDGLRAWPTACSRTRPRRSP
jgi:hypothetical protein